MITTIICRVGKIEPVLTFGGRRFAMLRMMRVRQVMMIRSPASRSMKADSRFLLMTHSSMSLAE